MAAESPAGPPPTMTTSASSLSLSTCRGAKFSSWAANLARVVVVKDRLCPAIRWAGLQVLRKLRRVRASGAFGATRRARGEQLKHRRESGEATDLEAILQTGCVVGMRMVGKGKR